MPKDVFSKPGDVTGVQILGQLPLLEWKTLYWRLWLSYDIKRENGVYLELRPKGAIVKTIRAKGKEISKIIKPMEK